ncbi:MAG TPA: hypothetical protein VH165_12105 [Kofleriaceae bacterium]|nr:hypothetical protein [Kofleriaceae bacterium]
MACVLLWEKIMLATRPASSMSSTGLPATVDAFVGSVLELVIYSVEALRGRLGKLAPRAAWQRGEHTL